MELADGDFTRDYGSHGLAEAHSPGFREHPGQQGRGEDRILEERHRASARTGSESKPPPRRSSAL